jgi:hypothetical protein
MTPAPTVDKNRFQGLLFFSVSKLIPPRIFLLSIDYMENMNKLLRRYEQSVNLVLGSFVLVCSGNAEKDTEWLHHHRNFDLDEDALAMESELYAQYAWTNLNQLIKVSPLYQLKVERLFL